MEFRADVRMVFPSGADVETNQEVVSDSWRTGVDSSLCLDTFGCLSGKVGSDNVC